MGSKTDTYGLQQLGHKGALKEGEHQMGSFKVQASQRYLYREGQPSQKMQGLCETTDLQGGLDQHNRQLFAKGIILNKSTKDWT